MNQSKNDKYVMELNEDNLFDLAIIIYVSIFFD